MRQLSAQFFDGKLVLTVFVVFCLDLGLEVSQFTLQLLNVLILFVDLLFKFLLLGLFFRFSLSQLVLELIEILLRVLLFLGLLHLRFSLLFLFFDLLSHFAAFLFKHDKLLVLGLHALLVLALFELKFSKVFFCHAQLFIKFRNLDVVFTFFVQGLKSFFLLSLHFEE